MLNPNKFTVNHEEEAEGCQKDNIITIEIQYWTNVDTHAFINHHSSLKYKNEYQQLKKKLNYYGILVKKRQKPKNFYRKSPYSPPNVYYDRDTNLQVCFPENGAFQVYYNNQKVFSKIQSKHFPSAQSILQILKKENNDKNISYSKQSTYIYSGKEKSPCFKLNPKNNNNNKYQEESVYLQSLKPRKKQKQSQIQTYRIRLKNKTQQFKRQYNVKSINDIPAIDFVKSLQKERNLTPQERLIFHGLDKSTIF